MRTNCYLLRLAFKVEFTNILSTLKAAGNNNSTSKLASQELKLTGKSILNQQVK